MDKFFGTLVTPEEYEAEQREKAGVGVAVN